ncbi:hypothetical protein JD504_02805 [Aeromonas hydrophila]|uniref:hypothetical protein n=1 Tax=Aeromonas hydrophila TaxID=644 RepID=UPI00191FE9E5|nr:hypothetical protein [Aeromonas hydrophila]MBL0669689.1 hypothetical protein [Aeromonas hydrophila]
MNPDYLETSKQFFVGWGTLMLINAVLAQGKNRSGLAWFFISLLLGPVATLILALFPKKNRKSMTRHALTMMLFNFFITGGSCSDSFLSIWQVLKIS